MVRTVKKYKYTESEDALDSAKSGSSGTLMQLFMAELSGAIDKLEFERSWKADSAVDQNLTIAFVFAGRTISIRIDSDLTNQWKSDSLHRMFSDAIHRVDRGCNVRWL